MKHLSSLTIITLLSVAFSVNVAARGSDSKPPHGEDAQTIFDEIDSDGNGEISEQEVNVHKPPRRKR